MGQKHTGLEGFKLMLEGKIIEWKHNERFYKINQELNQLEYSDYNKKDWKPSNYTVNDFLRSFDWEVVEGGSEREEIEAEQELIKQAETENWKQANNID